MLKTMEIRIAISKQIISNYESVIPKENNPIRKVKLQKAIDDLKLDVSTAELLLGCATLLNGELSDGDFKALSEQMDILKSYIPKIRDITNE